MSPPAVERFGPAHDPDVTIRYLTTTHIYYHQNIAKAIGSDRLIPLVEVNEKIKQASDA
ncbi:MAG: hypothetical protein ACR2PZ_13890 [Pseudomonadales bacterium]